MQLGVVRPSAGPQQFGDLRVGALAYELADRIAAVQQPAVGPVDQGDRRFAGNDAFEPWRIGSLVGGASSQRV